MSMISYAQNREDVLLARVLTGPMGFYIDVGASDPVVHSVTKWFYDRGWSGVNIEPHTPTFERLATARPRDANLNIAVSDRQGMFEFFEIPHTDGLHTLEQVVADKVRSEGHAVLARTVLCRTLADVCAWYVGDRFIDFMKIDAEGHERSVLAGMDFGRWQPRILVIEATEPCSTMPSYGEWEPLVIQAGYRFVFFDGLNRYYVRQEESDEFIAQLVVPANVFDAYTPYEQIAAVESATAASETARSERDHATALAASLKTEIDTLKSELTTTRTRLAATEEQTTVLTAELSLIREELNSTRDRLAHAVKQIDDQQAELALAANRERELACLHEELAALRATTVDRAAFTVTRSILAATRDQLEETRMALFAQSSR